MRIESGSRLLVAAALGVALVAPASAQTVKIGFHAPLTGFAAADGKSALNGAELAVDEINAAGGINGRKIELVVVDDQAKADQAVPLANKFIGEGLKIVVSGSYSGPTRAAAGSSRRRRYPTSPRTPSTRTSPARATTCSARPSWARSRGAPRRILSATS